MVPGLNPKTGVANEAAGSIARVRCRYLPLGVRRQCDSSDATSDAGDHGEVRNVELRDPSRRVFVYFWRFSPELQSPVCGDNGR